MIKISPSNSNSEDKRRVQNIVLNLLYNFVVT